MSPKCIVCGQRLGYLQRIPGPGESYAWACPEHAQAATPLKDKSAGELPGWALDFWFGPNSSDEGEWVVSVGNYRRSFGHGYRQIVPTGAMVIAAAADLCAMAVAEQAENDYREYDEARSLFPIKLHDCRSSRARHENDRETFVRVMAPKHLSAADVRRLADSKEKWGGERS